MGFGKNINKNLSSKYIVGMLAAWPKLLDHAKQFSTNELKTASARTIGKKE